MDIKEIKQIVDIIKRSELTEFEIEEKDFKLRICRKGHEVQSSAAVPHGYAFHAAGPPPAAQPTGSAPAPATDAKVEGKYIKSPMVGTFYTAPSPESPPFVKAGDSVSNESVVCIIEAMKVMNEIQAETSGTIAEVMVSNGESVEYGQPLFRLK